MEGMDGGMEGWRDGGMEGWRDGRDGGMDGWMDGWMDAPNCNRAALGKCEPQEKERAKGSWRRSDQDDDDDDDDGLF